MKKRHDFVKWLVKQHGQDDTPLGNFARDLARSSEFPAEGDRADLRESLGRTCSGDAWVLACFDVAWRQYQPTCATDGCKQPPGDQMSHCGEHALVELL
jgi:hypothetical protein